MRRLHLFVTCEDGLVEWATAIVCLLAAGFAVSRALLAREPRAVGPSAEGAGPVLILPQAVAPCLRFGAGSANRTRPCAAMQRLPSQPAAPDPGA
jgi:hypothetical protein